MAKPRIRGLTPVAADGASAEKRLEKGTSELATVDGGTNGVTLSATEGAMVCRMCCL